MKRPIRWVGRVTGETARKITGFSTPLGGVQWSDPGPSQREHVRRFLIVLEDRRALYKPMEWVAERHVRDSSMRIREACTDALLHLGELDFGNVPIRAIRAASRRYEDDASTDFFQVTGHPGQPLDHESRAGYFMALGALRATVGYNVALLAAHYGVDVEGNLSSILPILDEEGS